MFSPPPQLPQRPGRSNLTLPSLAVGQTDIVSAAANTNGILVRTLFLAATAGGSLNVTIEGVAVIFTAQAGTVASYNGPGLLVPQGQALRAANNGAAGASVVVTWDPL